MSDNEKLEQLMAIHTEQLFRIAYYYTKDLQLAEDIVQDVFIKFYHQKHYEERGEMKAYLARMTINKCKDYLKSWAYRKITFQHKFFTKQKSVLQDTLILQDEQDLLDEAILRLPIKPREAIVYYYLEEMTIKENAELLEIPEGTVKSRLKKGKELLKVDLQNIEWEVLFHG
ncbi:sigma-70 family RNA polymerase sigma factor [Lysinibacillus irui]|uniref:Sigma-70 family RNA polymerase sigma factor n=1 Tax=Lysinibacillus irui TaxID=2998077 RepID=A0AAJ5RRP8_9BACI|nr:sigma-70 family RNA polymerase sigma factor [Lysinibacillus irui]WDV08444.1 sigma-70 family RNA polymerase sigma factor [Lysinibacillus irui]